MVGYLILVEAVIAGFRHSIVGWLLVRAGTVIVAQDPILDYGSGGGSFSSGDVQVVMSVARANVVVGAYVLVLTVLALVVFRRRDVS